VGGEMGGDEAEVLSEASLRGGREGGGEGGRKQAVTCFRVYIHGHKERALLASGGGGTAF
jgi:hypothetical protein